MTATGLSEGASPVKDPIRLIWVLALGSFAIGTDLFVIAGLLGNVSHNLRVSVPTSGQLVSVFAVAVAVFAPVLAAATANVGRRPLLLTAIAIFAVANLTAALAPNFGILLATRLIAAAGAAMYTPVAAASAAMLVPAEQRGRALAIVLGGTTVATVLGVPATTFVGNLLSWRASFAVVGALAAAVLIVLVVTLPSLPTPPVPSLRQRVAVLGDLRVLGVVVTTVLLFLGGFTVYTYIGRLAASAGVTGTSLTWLLLVFGVFGFVGNAAGGRLTDRFGPARVLISMLVVFAISLTILPVLDSTAIGLAVVMAVWALSAWSLTVPQQHRLISIAPMASQIAIGLNSAGVFLGIGMAAGFGGLILDHVSVSALGYVGGLMVALALAVASIQILLERQQQTRSVQSQKVTTPQTPHS